VVLKYNTLLHKCLTEAHAFLRAQALQTSITGLQLTKAQQAEYKVLDHISTESKWFAERHCWKIKAGKIPWCPQVSCCINQILYWKGLLSKIQGSRIGSSVLSSWAKKAGISHSHDSLDIPPDALHNHIAAAYRSFNQIKKEPL